jgi:LmbE family N-acetylglucosaminyl deacetylase
LNYVDGHLEATIELRKDIVRQIRISQPDRIVCQSPERNWDRIGASHPDHLAAGEATIQAVYPDARNPFAFTDLLENEGLQPWRVKEVWVSGFAHPDHWVDITDTFDLKMAALHAHASQTAHNKDLEKMVREWGQRNAGMGGLPEGRIAEAFKIVNTA